VVRGAVRTATPVFALAAASLAVACADGPTAPASPAAAAAAAAPGPAFAKKTGGTTTPTTGYDGGWASYIESVRSVGDTVETAFWVTLNQKAATSIDIGNGSRITFPNAASSICDPATSSYGVGTWDSPCQPATRPVRITARTWVVKSTGKLATEFRPALRFVPGPAASMVTLVLKDAARAGTRVDYCAAGTCVDEAATDPSVATRLDARNGFAHRPVKHFSGYVVIANRSGSEAID
jgi:hypothetical protein